jgi:hypothetical protein
MSILGSVSRMEDAQKVSGGYPIRQKSAHGQPKPGTDIERRCRTCGASFVGLAAGKTGEVGIWRGLRWYCSAECAP